jgi:hypothetical protein
MKYIFPVCFLFLVFTFSCKSSKNYETLSTEKIKSDTITISNPEVEYEVTIIDGRFRSWFNTAARPRQAYSQSYLEARNKVWVSEWNRRANLPQVYDPNLYEMPINYNINTDYGFEVNYMIYNYMVFFQLTYKEQLGGYPARL